MAKNFIELKANLKAIEDFPEFITDIRKRVIERGIDKSLSESLNQLRSELMKIVNDVSIKSDKVVKEKVLEYGPSTVANVNMIEKSKVISGAGDKISKAKRDIVKHLFDVDLAKSPLGQGYTTDKNDNVFYIKSGLVKYRSEINPYSDYLSERTKVSKKMENAIYIDEDGNMKMPTGKSAPAKPECSNKPGQSERSQQVFESRKNSIKQHRLGAIKKSGGLPFVTWTMFKEDTSNFLSNSIDIGKVVDLVMDGDIERANSILGRLPRSPKLDKVLEKMVNLEQNNDLPKDLQAYRDIQTLVKNLRISKKIKESKVTYELISNYSESAPGEYDKFFDKLHTSINMWIITNQDVWFNSLVKKAEQVINNYAKRGE